MNPKPYRIKKILFTTNLTDHARHSFSYAASLAAMSHAEVIIFHVIQPASSNIEALIVNLLGQDRWEELRKEREFEVKETLVGKRKDAEAIRNALGLLRESALSDLRQEGLGITSEEIILVRGEVAEEIVHHAEKEQCDLIVMGTRQSGIFSRGGRDPVDQVLKKTKIPVLLVPKAD